MLNNYEIKVEIEKIKRWLPYIEHRVTTLENVMNNSEPVPISSGNWYRIAYNGSDKYVAINNSDSDGPSFAYSTDGTVWYESSTNINIAWNHVIYANDLFVACGSNDPCFAYSTDGIKWTAGTGINTGTWNHIIYGNGLYVACGSNLAYSTDGKTWIIATLNDFNSGDWSYLAYGNGSEGNIFVAVGVADPYTVYSTDGKTWYKGSHLDNITAAYRYVIYAENQFFACGKHPNYIVQSNNGKSWQKLNKILESEYNQLIYGNGILIACGGMSPYISYSEDIGEKWYQAQGANGPTPSYSWVSITYGNDMFVICASNNYTLAYSTDGKTWSTTVPYNVKGWNNISFINGKFILCGRHEPYFGTTSDITGRWEPYIPLE